MEGSYTTPQCTGKSSQNNLLPVFTTPPPSGLNYRKLLVTKQKIYKISRVLEVVLHIYTFIDARLGGTVWSYTSG